MKISLNRRAFLGSVAKSLGGVALFGLTPSWTFAAMKPIARTINRSTWKMGTLINLTLLEETYTPRLVDGAFGALGRVDRTLSAHRVASALSRLNRQPGSWHNAERDVLRVARAARHYGDLTDGALDVTVLPVMREYGFIPGGSGSTDVAALLEHVDYTKLHVDEHRVRLEEGIGIDFGGIAKGYAVDESMQILKAAGVKAALIEAGGDLFALGRPDPAKRWRIGIRDPLRPDALFALLDVENEAVATSGLYAQSRNYHAKTVTHLINPVTGLPVDHVLSATIVTSTTMAADALATATCVMEPKRAHGLIDSLPDTEGLWVYADGSFYA
ncbi:MAG: FAD:protein FMN transferase, partial [Rhodothermales bacterium]